MKRILLAFVVLGSAAFAAADDLKSQIVSMDKAMRTIMMKKDIDAFVKTMKSGVSKDFKYSESGRTETFDQMVAGMRQGMAMMTKMKSVDAKLLSLTVKGNSATSSTRHSLSGITMDAKHKSHTMVFTGVSDETYRKSNGKWLMTSMTWKNQTGTMDGKPMPAQ